MGFLRRILGGTPAERPHDNPDLESMLPATVAGRPLERWSVRGERAFSTDGRRLAPHELAGIERDFGQMGVALADVSHAVAGRPDPSDPPYLVDAWRFGDRPATEAPLDLGVAHKGLAGWQWGTLGGKPVARGTVAMLEQTSSLRGRPYVVRSGPVQFSIATDDERWAEEVCRMLPESSEPRTGPGQPATGNPRTGIEQALRQLARGEGQFAIFEVPGGRNFYAQVHTQTTVDESLYGEVVGNQYLAERDRLSEANQARLVAAGWTADQTGSGNFHREWLSWTGGSVRSAIADDILDALEVFGSRPAALWIEVSSA